MITADQLVAHLVGDYVLQSDWMAQEKTKRWGVAMVHGFVYSLPFLMLRPSLAAFLVIWWTHALIDRYRLARFVCYVKNFLAPRVDESAPAPLFWFRWEDCSGTGYHKDRPAWLAVWLLILADNTLHILINGAALRWL